MPKKGSSISIEKVSENAPVLDKDTEYLIKEAVDAFVDSMTLIGVDVVRLDMAFAKKGEEEECTNLEPPTS